MIFWCGVFGGGCVFFEMLCGGFFWNALRLGRWGAKSRFAVFWNALRRGGVPRLASPILCRACGGDWKQRIIKPELAIFFFFYTYAHSSKLGSHSRGTKIGFAHLVRACGGWLKIKNPYSIKTALLPVLFFVPITVIQASLMPPICKKIRPNKFGLNEIQILLFRRGTKIGFAHLVRACGGWLKTKNIVFH